MWFSRRFNDNIHLKGFPSNMLYFFCLASSFIRFYPNIYYRAKIIKLMKNHQRDFGTCWLLKRMGIFPFAYYNYLKKIKTAYRAEKEKIYREIKNIYHDKELHLQCVCKTRIHSRNLRREVSSSSISSVMISPKERAWFASVIIFIISD